MLVDGERPPRMAFMFLTVRRRLNDRENATWRHAESSDLGASLRCAPGRSLAGGGQSASVLRCAPHRGCAAPLQAPRAGPPGENDARTPSGGTPSPRTASVTARTPFGGTPSPRTASVTARGSWSVGSRWRWWWLTATAKRGPVHRAPQPLRQGTATTRRGDRSGNRGPRTVTEEEG